MALYLRQLPEPIEYCVGSKGGDTSSPGRDARFDDSEMILVWQPTGEPIPVRSSARVAHVPARCSVGPGGLSEETRLVGTPPGVRAAVRSVPNIGRVTFARAEAMVASLARDLGVPRHKLSADRYAVVLFADRSSLGAELLAAAMGSAASGLPVVGGSFARPGLALDGVARRNGAVVALFESEVPLASFMVQPFHPTAMRTVVTACSTSGEAITELDGLPAVERFADLTGIHPDALIGRSRDVVRALPYQLARMIAGRPVTRPVIGADGESLVLLGGVQRGAVLRLLQRSDDVVGDMVDGIRSAIASLPVPPAAALGFACSTFLEGESGVALARGLQHLGVPTCATDGIFHGPVHTCGGVSGLVFGDGGR